jgi:hypothetical protein
MNIIVKSAVASVLALSATGAFALGVPGTGSSDLVLVVENLTTQAVYASDTNISISSVLPTSELVASADTGTTLSSAISINAAPVVGSSTLQSFLAATGPGGTPDSFGWIVEGAQYVGNLTTNASQKVPGNAIAITTSALGTGNNVLMTGAGLLTLEGFTSGVNTDVTAGGLQPLQTATETTAASLSATAAGHYGFFSAPDLGTPGTAQNLFGFTGGGTPTTPLQSYLLGSVALNATTGTLTFTGNGPGAPSVPLPAAVWLFGSGLMGLVGVSRRRKAAGSALAA